MYQHNSNSPASHFYSCKDFVPGGFCACNVLATNHIYERLTVRILASCECPIFYDKDSTFHGIGKLANRGFFGKSEFTYFCRRLRALTSVPVIMQHPGEDDIKYGTLILKVSLIRPCHALY